MEHIIDAKQKSLGRVATEAALLLQGKHSPSFERHIPLETTVVITNAAHVKVTGNKENAKIYYRHTGYPGGLKMTTYRKAFEKDPRNVIMHAVRGMLPKNLLQKKFLKRLIIK